MVKSVIQWKPVIIGKKRVLVVPIVTVKCIKHVAWTKTQPVKVGTIHVRCPCIIYFIIKHKSKECCRKIEVHNMFRTKHFSYNAMTTPKPPKINNVPINVIVVITTRSQH